MLKFSWKCRKEWLNDRKEGGGAVEVREDGEGGAVEVRG